MMNHVPVFRRMKDRQLRVSVTPDHQINRRISGVNSS